MVPPRYARVAGDEEMGVGVPSSSKESQTVCVVYPLELCCVWAFSCDTIVARKFNVSVPLDHLIPDILMTDLPKELQVESNQFQFDQNPAFCLGRGGFGKRHYKPPSPPLPSLLLPLFYPFPSSLTPLLFPPPTLLCIPCIDIQVLCILGATMATKLPLNYS